MPANVSFDITSTIGFQEVRNASLMLQGLRGGEYTIEFWNTRDGKTSGGVTASTGEDGGLVIPLPSVKSDLALKVKLNRK